MVTVIGALTLRTVAFRAPSSGCDILKSPRSPLRPIGAVPKRKWLLGHAAPPRGAFRNYPALGVVVPGPPSFPTRPLCGQRRLNLLYVRCERTGSVSRWPNRKKGCLQMSLISLTLIPGLALPFFLFSAALRDDMFLQSATCPIRECQAVVIATRTNAKPIEWQICTPDVGYS